MCRPGRDLQLPREPDMSAGSIGNKSGDSLVEIGFFKISVGGRRQSDNLVDLQVLSLFSKSKVASALFDVSNLLLKSRNLAVRELQTQSL